MLLERIDDAIADFEKCIKLQPDFALVHAQLAFSKVRLVFQQLVRFLTRTEVVGDILHLIKLAGRLLLRMHGVVFVPSDKNNIWSNLFIG